MLMFVLRNIGVYGLAMVGILAKATLLANFAGFATCVAQLVVIFTAYDALMPDVPVDEINFEPATSLMIFIAILVWMGALLVFVWRAGHEPDRFHIRTQFGSTEHIAWRNATSRARELVSQAVVARSLGLSVFRITLPVRGVGHIDFSLLQRQRATSRERVVVACALSMAADALHQDHSALDWAIARDAMQEEPEGFTRDEIIREAARAVAAARHGVDERVLVPIENELRYLGRLDESRLDELLVETLFVAPGSTSA